MQEIIEQLTSYQMAGNTAYEYAIAGALFIGALFLLKIFQLIVLARLRAWAKKTKNDFDDAIISMVEGVRKSFYLLVGLYIAIRPIEVHEAVVQVIKVFLIISIVYEVVRSLNHLVDYFVGLYTRKFGKERDETKDAKEHTKSIARTMRILVQALIWILGLLLVLSNLGINITSLVASLGIGGIAIALALQNVFGDLFSSFSIYVDKPFKVGDLIMIGTDMGTVKKIGMKSTRIETLQGEEMTISNQELTSARVQNFRRMQKRRVKSHIGVVYGTGAEKLEQIPKIIKKVIDIEAGVDFDRCHFHEYGDFSLNYEFVFYVKSADYKEHMEKRHNINLEIYKQFSEHGIEFAYPTQTLFVNKT